jgi:hypothetical protein
VGQTVALCAAAPPAPVPTASVEPGLGASDEDADGPQDQGRDQNEPQKVDFEPESAEHGEDQQEHKKSNRFHDLGAA